MLYILLLSAQTVDVRGCRLQDTRKKEGRRKAYFQFPMFPHLVAAVHHAAGCSVLAYLYLSAAPPAPAAAC